MKRALIRLFLVVPLFCGLAICQGLDNDAIVKLVKAGLGTDVIITMVQTQPGNYKLGVDETIALKTAGVPDKVISAMAAKASAPASAAPQSGPAAADSGTAREIGVYYQKDGDWRDLLPEVVNWKTGGVMKSIATAGIVKGDVNGNIQGTASRTKLASPVEILIYAPEGVAVTEYQLLKLHENRGYREFRTVTGGVMHVSGGSTRDLIPFEGKKIASRTFRLSLTNLKPGEYGVLPPGLNSSSSAGAQLGKMYTFSIVE
ncbi:MAG: hypothetical protein ACLQBJ_03000 [Bryobacteraceae bacterium]